MTVQIVVHGAGGRMGKTIMSLVLQDAKAQIAGAIDQPNHSQIGKDLGQILGVAHTGVSLTSDLHRVLDHADVVIDFSAPVALDLLVDKAIQFKKPLVVGSTGFEPDVRSKINQLSSLAPVLVAPNMSLGVNLLFHLAKQAAKILGEDYDIEIIEMHHRAKVDSPSGTAKGLYESVVAARKWDVEKSAVHGRSGIVGARKKNEIGVMALRGGDVVGDHTVIFAGAGERVELTHRAHTREIFANGAVRAAHWLVSQPPGLYSMTDVLGV